MGESSYLAMFLPFLSRGQNSCELLDILGVWPNVHLMIAFKTFILPSVIPDIFQKGIPLCLPAQLQNLTLY